MPIDNSIVHQIHKKPDGQPASLTLRDAELAASEALEQLLAGLIEAYNSKPNKAWGYFHEESGAYPFSGWLQQLLDQELDFVGFSAKATEQLKTLMESSNLALGGHVLFIRYRQGMTAFLVIALLHHTEGVTVTDDLDVAAARHLDLSSLNMAARINLTEWKQNASAKNYISFIRGRSGKRVSDYFRDFIGCVEGSNPEEETNTLLQAFSDYVGEAELEPDALKQKTKALSGYVSSQARQGEQVALEELSGLIDEEQPRAFYDYIRHKDYGLAPEIPPDKRAVSNFMRFYGKADGLSISFEAHLLGERVEYDESEDALLIKHPPKGLIQQLRNKKR
ncbi:nucleoid-associated protein YejK [Halopseudomonas phragmitis]|uniref:Nucleoid-associated protein YejK n=2 Tax=Pseudomonadaceae TaxID=135621 RepID=A0A1V0B0M3_9GAMM|nr:MULTISPECIES: nucleoid-associated protein YejK [Pseudomonadaceae]AQZ93493.1 nucleoid-associated protein YejK [Halopseudomonas phragmitis]PAU85626.1 nucleoid-associated protein YejK [Pseudomonas sp. WN033]RHW19815.1 nucleoid-associated protein YejK [Pseudomonas jilinensis]